jgi:hypothetical protein
MTPDVGDGEGLEGGVGDGAIVEATVTLGDGAWNVVTGPHAPTTMSATKSPLM